MILSKTVQNAALAHLKMQNRKPRIFIIAGEVSGDVLGAGIISAMQNTAEIAGIGGENMARCGLKSIFPMGDLAVMGATEVLAHAKTLTRRMRQATDAILEYAPDIVLTIDAPGFARGVIKRIHQSDAGKKLIADGMKFHHVVAPQVWAWRPGRAKKYAKTFDKLYAFFDFEVPYFTKYGLDTVAVGHPIADNLAPRRTKAKTNEKIIALIPGSRMSEVKKLLPLMRDVAQRMAAGGYTGYKFVIPTVETTDEYIRNNIKKWSVTPELVSADKRYDIYAKTYIAIAASGTVSAELAIMHIPAIIVYKMNAITTWLIKRMINVRWVSLVNILMNKTIYPEFLGPAATADNVLDAAVQLSIPSVREKMIADCASADTMWRRGSGGAAAKIAEHVLTAI